MFGKLSQDLNYGIRLRLRSRGFAAVPPSMLPWEAGRQYTLRRGACGAAAMCSYNKVDGDWSCENKYR